MYQWLGVVYSQKIFVIIFIIFIFSKAYREEEIKVACHSLHQTRGKICNYDECFSLGLERNAPSFA